MAASVAELVGKSEILFLCLPSATHVRAVFEGDGILKNIRRRQDRRRSRHFLGQPDPRFRQAVAGKGRIMGRCADRAYPSGRAGWHAERDGRRTAGIVCGDRAVDPLLCHRCDQLRRHRRGAGDKNPQQHGAVSDRQRAGRGGRGRPAQWRRSGAAARYVVEGISRQLCAAQSRHEGDRAREIFPNGRSRPSTR